MIKSKIRLCSSQPPPKEIRDWCTHLESQSEKIDFHLVCPGVVTIPGQFGHCAENDGVLLGLVDVVGHHYQLMNDSSALTFSCMKEEIFASSTLSVLLVFMLCPAQCDCLRKCGVMT